MKKWHEDSPKNRIKLLEEELAETQFTILRLMPEKLEHILMKLFLCEPPNNPHIVAHEVALEITKTVVPDYYVISQGRGRCPLCGAGTFSLDEGMLRHLEGTHNAGWCPVMRSVFKHGQSHNESHK